MLIRDHDRPDDESQWRAFVAANAFGHLVAGGRDRVVPVVVPTQFLLDGDEIVLHLARPNPIWEALAENPTVVLSVAGDWAYVPSAWKAIGDEDPATGIPTTYYAAVQFVGTATVVDADDEVAAILRRQLADLQPEMPTVDPIEHGPKLRGIRGLRISVDEVRAKFKFGGNADVEHRQAVLERLVQRDGPGDRSAAAHLRRTFGSD